MSRQSFKWIGLLSLAMFIVSASQVVLAQSTSKSVTGTVMTVDDKPAQTHVQLFSMKPKAVGPVPRKDGDSPTGDAKVGMPDVIKLQRTEGKPLMETNTDASGKFTFTNVQPGPYVVIAGTGRNMAKVTVEVKPNEDPKPLALKLPSK